MRKLLIVGGGIAGLNAAVAALRRGSTQVTLIDSHSYQTLPPQLARGAAGLAAFGQMALMLPESDDRLTRVRATVTRLDLARRAVVAGDQEYVGDRLLIAVGRGPARCPAAADGPVHAPYDAEAASRLRLAWHAALAAAAHRRPLPDVPVRLAIVGGGAFGCELALAFATMRPFACQRYGLPPALVAISLYEAAERLLPDWPARAAEIVGRELYLGEVETCLASRVVARTAYGLLLADGTEQPADVVVWACGREPHPLLASAGAPLTADRTLSVDSYLRVAGQSDVFAAGDCAAGGYGWDWARISGRTAAANATSRLPRRAPVPPPRRRYLGLPFGRTLALVGETLSARGRHPAAHWRLLAERYAVGGLPLLLQAWPAPAPDHSLAAWRDAMERRRGRHAVRSGW